MNKESMKSLLVVSVGSVLAGAVALLALGGVAQAQDGRPAWIVACEGDMNKLCAKEVKDNADVRPCLAKNEEGLSQACKDTFLRQYKILELCKEDIEKICGGATDGKTLKACFNEKIDQLSAKCKSALVKGKKEHDKEAVAKPAEAPAKGEVAAKPDKKGKKKAPAAK
jgi:hypothetical protein